MFNYYIKRDHSTNGWYLDYKGFGGLISSYGYYKNFEDAYKMAQVFNRFNMVQVIY